MEYSDEQINFLRRYTADGWTAAQVMRAFNRTYGTDISRNAVLGKLDRLKVKRPKKVKVKPKAKEPRARVAYLPHLRQMAAGEGEPERGPLPFTGDPAEIAPEQRRTILDLTNETCRWPYGTPGQPDFFYCGALEADCHGGHPYCPAHTAISRPNQQKISEEERERRAAHGRWLSRLAARKRAAA